MIIQILCNIMEDGYQKKGRDAWISPFFAGANVAFRREAVENAGGYDESCITGEDRDICVRIGDAGWELYFEPKAKVGHKNRLTVRSLFRQWFGYGYHHPYVAKKHSSGGFRVFRPNFGRSKGPVYKPLFRLWLPFSVSIFLTSFLAVHVLLALSVLFAALGLYIPSAVTGAVLAAIAIAYFRSDIGRKNVVDAVVFVALRYLANSALLLGGLVGGIKLRMLHIGATFDYKG